jgi:WD40 repeat protein
MRRRIPTWLSGVAWFGLLAFAAGPGLAQHPSQAPTGLARCWQDLGAEDAELAYRAACRLMRSPERAVELLGKHLQAARAPDLRKIQACLKDLSSPTFAVRQRAFQELQRLGEVAEAPLRKALEAKPDLETRNRVKLLLSHLERPASAPEKLRQIRAVEVLETLASPRARELLQVLARGYPEHHQTRQARESLLRLGQRHPVPEAWLARAKGPPPGGGKEGRVPFGALTRLGATRFRHQGPGSPGGFSPGSSLLISRDRTSVYLWETQTGKLRRKFGIAATCLAVAPSGTQMALGLAGKGQQASAVVCWDWQAGRELSRLELSPGVNPLRMAYSADRARVLIQCSEGSLRAWDTRSDRAATLWQPADGLRSLHGFSPDGTRVVVGSRANAYVLDVKKKRKHLLPAMEREPRHVAFSPDSRWVAVASDFSRERVNVCDAATGKLVWRSADGAGAYAHSVRFSADGKALAVAAYRQEIALWDLRTGKFLRTLPGSRDCTIGALSADRRWLASAGQTLGVWDLQSGRRVDVGDGHRADINGLALSRRYDWIATSNYTDVRLWDPLTGRRKRLLDTGGNFVRGVAVSPDGRLVAVGQPGPGEGFLKVWEAATGRLVYRLPGHGVRNYGRAADVRFSPDRRFLFSWGDDGHLRKWDVRTGKALLEVPTQPPGTKRSEREEKPEFSQLQHGWASQPERFLRLEANGDLRTFDLNTGKEGPVVNLGARPFAAGCAFSPTGRHVACYGYNLGVAVRDATTGKPAFTLAVPGRPRGLAFSADGRALAAALEDRVIVVEVATGKVRLTAEANAQAVAFSADGRFLATAMADTTALLWDLALLAEAPKGQAGSGP